MPDNRQKRAWPEAHALAESIGCGVLMLDANLGLRFANSTAWTLLDCSSEEELKRNWMHLLPRLRFEGLSQLVPGGRPQSWCRDLDLPKGQRMLRGEAHVIDNGAHARYLVLIKDRLTLGAVDDELVGASHDHVLSVLSSAIAHNLNGPANNMQLALSLLESSIAALADPPSEWRERADRYLRLMSDELARLAAQIRDLPAVLSRPRVERACAFDLGPMLDEVGRLLKHEATTRQIRRNVVLPPGPLTVVAAPDGVKLALLNLAIALLEGSRPGGTLFLETGARNGSVEIVVRVDNAVLTDDALDAIERLSYGSVKTHVGLFVARLIVEANQGSLYAADDADSGANFRVTLPVAASSS